LAHWHADPRFRGSSVPRSAPQVPPRITAARAPLERFADAPCGGEQELVRSGPQVPAWTGRRPRQLQLLRRRVRPSWARPWECSPSKRCSLGAEPFYSPVQAKAVTGEPMRHAPHRSCRRFPPPPPGPRRPPRPQRAGEKGTYGRAPFPMPWCLAAPPAAGAARAPSKVQLALVIDQPAQLAFRPLTSLIVPRMARTWPFPPTGTRLRQPRPYSFPFAAQKFELSSTASRKERSRVALSDKAGPRGALAATSRTS